MLVAVVIPPPQSYVPPPLAVSVTLDATQVTVLLAGVTDATGAVMFWLTMADAVAVHPLAAVTVTV